MVWEPGERTMIAVAVTVGLIMIIGTCMEPQKSKPEPWYRGPEPIRVPVTKRPRMIIQGRGYCAPWEKHKWADDQVWEDFMEELDMKGIDPRDPDAYDIWEEKYN